MKHIRYTKTKDGAMVDVSGGVSLRAFIKDMAEKGLSGLEKLYWIPGTVGGGIKMNAGSFGQSISDTLEEINIIDENRFSDKDWERSIQVRIPRLSC